jgi:hypothetical protein
MICKQVLEKLICPGKLFLPGLNFMCEAFSALSNTFLSIFKHFLFNLIIDTYPNTIFTIIPVVVNTEIAFLRLNPSLKALHSIKSDDPVICRTDECLKLLGFAMGKCLVKGEFCRVHGNA